MLKYKIFVENSQQIINNKPKRKQIKNRQKLKLSKSKKSKKNQPVNQKDKKRLLLTRYQLQEDILLIRSWLLMEWIVDLKDICYRLSLDE